MKKIALGLAALVLTTTAAHADNKNRVVSLENHSGRTIVELYGSRSDIADWENDLLGSDVMADSTHKRINMFDGSTACYFDFKAVFMDGSVRFRARQNVCAETTITFGTLKHGSTN